MRSIRQIFQGLVVGSFLVASSAGTAVATPVVHTNPPAPETSEEALGQFGACLAGQEDTPQGQLLLLLDHSSSLEIADPQQDRRPASKYLVDQLIEYVDTSDAEIDIQIAGFADDFSAGSWTQLNGEQRSSLHSQIDDYTDNLTPIDTDYVNAFSGAQRSLAENRGDYPSECQAIAWFTDGAFYLDPRTNADDRAEFGTHKPYAPDSPLDTYENAERVRDIGQEEFCRTQGTMDQVRAEGITVLGFALHGVEDDWDFMRNAVEASDCGDITEPAGTFFEAADASELVLAFDAIAQPGHPPFQYSSVPVCDGSACEEGFLTFTLDQAISKIQVLAMSRDTNARPVFISPDGKTLDAADSDFPFDIEQLTEHTVSVELDKPAADAWTGGWKLAMVTSDASGAQEDIADISIRLKSSVGVQWPDELSQKARIGETLEDVQLRLVDSEIDEEIDPDVLEGQVEVASALVDAAGNEYPIVNGQAEDLKTPIDVDLTEAAIGSATINIETRVTTAAATDTDGNEVAGTQLQPVRSQVNIDLQPPANFPQVVSTAQFGALDGETQTAGTVEVTGPGCVWLDSTDVLTSPAETNTITVSSEHADSDSCMEVPADKTIELPLDLEMDTVGNGGINGVLTIQTAPLDEHTRALPTTVAFNAQAMKPLDTARATVSTMIAIIVGVAIPLALFYLMKLFTARIPKATYRYAVVTAARDGSQQLELPAQNEIPTVHHNGSRSMTLGNYKLVAQMSWSPFNQTSVAVTGSSEPSVGSPRAAHAHGHAVLPQDISSQWVVRQKTEDLFEVLFILDGATSTIAVENWKATLASARSGFDDAVHELDILSQAARAKSSKNVKQPSGTGPAGSSSVFVESQSSNRMGSDSFESGDSPDPFGNDPFGDDPFGSSGSGRS